MIYADNAATTRLDNQAYQAMVPFLNDEYGNASSAYSFSRVPRQALRDARAAIAECIGAKDEEVFFTSGGTESNNWALKGVSFARKNEKKRIITSAVEHHAILHSCEFLEKIGMEIVYLPVDRTGSVSMDILKRSISDKTALVSLILANNEIGSLQDIAPLARIAHDYGALFHTDAVQAVGHIPVNVCNLGVDLLSASAHKFNGPKGVGFLYIRDGIEIQSYSSGGAQERKLRAGTENIAAIVGMAVALKNNVSMMDENTSHLEKIASIFLRRLASSGIDYLLNGSSKRLPGHISISIKNEDGERLLHRLDLKGVCISTGSACNASENEISHVIKAVAIPASYAKGTIRISFGKENTEQDADKIAEAIISVCRGGKHGSN
ncbi:cysteine desulfurase [Aminivibrio pyruvatiphilus]|uniref:cysteine desulfurase n=1 Tax=Aminivibrio pyruvatiphilus TaxID=1005740 RepID=A0A4R8M8L8_9BACT|nr:cysteine desulfurase family protein [Aminivibrio pyruvatiphilus]NLE25897.1 cysteine desulfurase [Clostridiaceae bacterium]TDY61880.1 cysteine desulfurase [Aminivibrio pyruvatiphilus]